MRLHNMLKYVGILGVLVFCTACGTGHQTDNKTETGSSGNASYPGSKGVTAVAMKDSTLTNCYILRKEEPDQNTSTGKITQEDTADYEIKAGDIVLYLHEDSKDSDTVHVMIPYNDEPHIYGYLPKEDLSTDAQDIQNGNQAIVYDGKTYDKPDGTVVETMNGMVQILQRKDTWCQVEQLGTGADPAWVRADNLSFDFDQDVIDIDAGVK